MNTDWNKTIDGLLVGLAEHRETDIAHLHLGDGKDFAEAESTKNDVVDYLTHVVNLMRDATPKASESILKDGAQKIATAVSGLNGLIERVGTTAGNVHREHFVAERTKELKELKDLATQNQVTLSTVETFLRMIRLEKALFDKAGMATLRTGLAKTARQARSVHQELNGLLESAKGQALRKGIDEAGATFLKRASEHSRHERNWFAAFIGAFIATVVAVAVVILEPALIIKPFIVILPITEDSMVDVVGSLFRRILLISTPALFMRIALGKYNLERNLRLVYMHRVTVLNQYQAVEQLFEGGTNAKVLLQSELAKVIFADASTGYVQSSSSSEINIGPAADMAAHLLPSSGRVG